MKFTGMCKKHKLPEAPGEILDMRWIMGANDWWVQTDKGWFWLDGQTLDGRSLGKPRWVLAPLGPPQ